MLICILYVTLTQPPPCVVHRPIYHSITPISPIILIASVNSPHEIPIPFPVPFSRFTLLNTDRRYTLSDNMSNTAWRLRRWFRPVCVNVCVVWVCVCVCEWMCCVSVCVCVNVCVVWVCVCVCVNVCVVWVFVCVNVCVEWVCVCVRCACVGGGRGRTDRK
jgi:hypothetical protein